MNYLAHLFLAGTAEEAIVGNFMGDFVKGTIAHHQNSYSEHILQGIVRHRQIDCFTDSHPVYLTSKKRIKNSQGLYAGVAIDIIYDYFLANHWNEYSDRPLEEFAADNYNILLKYEAVLPLKLKKILPQIIAENWLVNYREIAGIQRTFWRLSRRVKRHNNLATAADELINNYSDLEADFRDFFPQLVASSQ